LLIGQSIKLLRLPLLLSMLRLLLQVVARFGPELSVIVLDAMPYADVM
jgi:hypothetical protein